MSGGAFLFASKMFQELKRRKVYPVIVAYALVAWVLLQIAEVTFEPLGLPGWAMTGLVILAIAGFPVAMALSWFFDFTTTGIQQDSGSTQLQEDNGDPPSIAVLPFVDMSPEKDQAYFCEGVAEEILNTLTRIPELSVAARMASFKYRDGVGDVQDIGKELGVNAILEGSVRKFGNHLRVTAQLIKVSNGYHLWSRSFDEDLEDIFVIQDEIAMNITKALLNTLHSVNSRTTRNIGAYEYYLRGRHFFFNRSSKTGMITARQLFRQAIDADPEFALAWAGYADCHSFLIMYVDPNEEYRETANRASARAIELGPDLAEAHASRGLAFLVSDKYEESELEFNRAIDLNPRLFEAYYYYARSRFHQGDMDKAIELFGKASEVNPEDYQSRLLRVQILRGSGRIEQATAEAQEGIAVVERHLDWNPDDIRALQLGAGSLILLGDSKRAEEWLRRALEIDSDDSVLLYNVACNYATMGKSDEALDYLEQAVNHGTVSFAWMENDEDLASLRGDSRFDQLFAAVEQQH
jgi:TolB-like protein/Tfp pilus assembly protein PilF